MEVVIEHDGDCCDSGCDFFRILNAGRGYCLLFGGLGPATFDDKLFIRRPKCIERAVPLAGTTTGEGHG